MTCVEAMGFAQDIRNSNNSLIGYARGVPMRYAALYFFFNLF